MGLLANLKQKGKVLTKEQKGAFVLLVFLGLGGIILGSMSFGANIRRPFEIQLAKIADADPYLTLDQREEKEKEDQKLRDSDSDELSDYDELYVFKTSPYVSDTDSDGFSDKEEVYSGNNPNCPEGKVCGTVLTTVDSTGNDTSASDFVDSISNTPFGDDLKNFELQSEEDIQKYIQSITMDEIRKALINAGVPADKIDEISDEQLQQLFNQTVSDASANGQLGSLVEQLQGQQETAATSDTTTETTTTTP